MSNPVPLARVREWERERVNELGRRALCSPVGAGLSIVILRSPAKAGDEESPSRIRGYAEAALAQP